MACSHLGLLVSSLALLAATELRFDRIEKIIETNGAASPVSHWIVEFEGDHCIKGAPDDAHKVDDLQPWAGERAASAQPRSDLRSLDDLDAVEFAGGAPLAPQVFEAIGRDDGHWTDTRVDIALTHRRWACGRWSACVDPGLPSEEEHPTEKSAVCIDNLHRRERRNAQAKKFEGEDQLERCFIAVHRTGAAADVHIGWESGPLEVVQASFEGDRLFWGDTVQKFQERLYASVTEVHRLERSAEDRANTRRRWRRREVPAGVGFNEFCA